MNSKPISVLPLPVTPCTAITFVLGIPPIKIESNPAMPVFTKSRSGIMICLHWLGLGRLFSSPRLGSNGIELFSQQQPPIPGFRQVDEMLKAAFTPRLCYSHESVETYSLRGSRTSDQRRAFQSIQSTLDDRIFIA